MAHKIDINKIPELARELAASRMPVSEGVLWEVLRGDSSIEQALGTYAEELEISGVEEPDWLADWDLDDTEKTMEIVNVMLGHQDPDEVGAGGPSSLDVTTAVEQSPELIDLAMLVEETLVDPTDMDDFEMLMDDVNDAYQKLDQTVVDDIMAQVDVAMAGDDPAGGFQSITDAILRGEKYALVQGVDDAGGLGVGDDDVVVGDDVDDDDVVGGFYGDSKDIYGGYTNASAFGAMVRHAIDYKDMTVKEAEQWAGGKNVRALGPRFGGDIDWDPTAEDVVTDDEIDKEVDEEDVTELYGRLDLSSSRGVRPGFDDPMMTPGRWFAGEDSLFVDEKALAVWTQYFREARDEYIADSVDFVLGDFVTKMSLADYTTDKLRKALSMGGDRQNEMAASLFHWFYNNVQEDTLSQYEGDQGFSDLYGVISNVLTGQGITQEYLGAPAGGNYISGIVKVVPELESLLIGIYPPGLLPSEEERAINIYDFPDIDKIKGHDFQFVSKTKLDPRTKGGLDYLEALVEANRDQRDVFDRAFDETHPGLTGSWYEGQKRGLFLDASLDRYFSQGDDEATMYGGYGEGPIPTPFAKDKDWYSSWLQNRSEHQTSLFSNVEELANFLHDNRWNFDAEDYARAGISVDVGDEDVVVGEEDVAAVDKRLAKRLILGGQSLDLDDPTDKQRFYQFKTFNPLLHKANSQGSTNAIMVIKQAAISALTPVGASAQSRSAVAKQVERDYDTFTSTGEGSPLSFLKYMLGGGRTISSQSTLWGGGADPAIRLPGGTQAPLF